MFQFKRKIALMTITLVLIQTIGFGLLEGAFAKKLDPSNAPVAKIEPPKLAETDWSVTDWESEIVLPQDAMDYQNRLVELITKKQFDEVKKLRQKTQKMHDKEVMEHSWEPDSSVPAFTNPINFGDLQRGDIVRVFTGTPGNPTGKWWLFRADIDALEQSVPGKYSTLAEAIKQKYSIPELPTHFMRGSIRANVEFRAGPTAKWSAESPGNTYGSRDGGGMQLEIVGFDQGNWDNFLNLENAPGTAFKTYPLSNL